MLLENGFFISELRSGVGQLCLGDLDVVFRHEQLRLGNVLVALRLLPGLRRGHLAADQLLLAFVDLQALRQDGAGLDGIGIRLLYGHFGAEDRSLRPCHLRLLLGGVEPGKDLALLHQIAVIGVELGDGRPDLEANLGKHTRLDGAEAEHADRDVLHDRGHWHFKRPQREVRKGYPQDTNWYQTER